MADNNCNGVCYSEANYIIRPEHLNGQGRLFGGQLLMWIDEIAGISARRYCKGDITTACVDKLNFLGSAHFNDTLVLCAEVTYIGNTSIEVTVNTYTEQLDGTRKLINVAYLVEVALDENEKPKQVPRYEPQNDEERKKFDAGAIRNHIRKERRVAGV